MSLLVQKLRLKRGWSQQQLAELSGLSTRTIQRVEGGQTPTVETLKSLASVFEVDFQELRAAIEPQVQGAAQGAPRPAATPPVEPTVAVMPPHPAESTTMNPDVAPVPSPDFETASSRYVAARRGTNDLGPMPDDEVRAFREVRSLRGFYIHAAQYVLVIAGLSILDVFTSPNRWWVQWPALGWGIGLTAHYLSISKRRRIFGPDWEKRQIEKRLGRTL